MTFYFILSGLVLLWIPERVGDVKSNAGGVNVTLYAGLGVIVIIAGSAVGCVSVGLFTMSVETKVDKVTENSQGIDPNYDRSSYFGNCFRVHKGWLPCAWILPT